MAKKEKRRHLGRGLEALLASTTTSPAGEESSSNAGGDSRFPPDMELRESIRHIPITGLKANPYQPRTTWDEETLKDLTESIRINGVIQPIVVRQRGAHFEVIAGERRLRAAQQAGLEEIPALVREATDSEMLELALAENIHRSDLNPIERALAYQNYLNTFSLTQAQAAAKLGEDRSVIANHLRLLDLPREVRQMLTDGALSMGHGRAILALPTDELRRKLANRAMAGRLSVREVERMVRRHLQEPTEQKQAKEKPAHIMDLENRLRDALGTKVRIEAGKKGSRGRIVIDFYSLDEFDSLMEKMGIAGAESV